MKEQRNNNLKNNFKNEFPPFSRIDNSNKPLSFGGFILLSIIWFFFSIILSGILYFINSTINIIFGPIILGEFNKFLLGKAILILLTIIFLNYLVLRIILVSTKYFYLYFFKISKVKINKILRKFIYLSIFFLCFLLYFPICKINPIEPIFFRMPIIDYIFIFIGVIVYPLIVFYVLIDFFEKLKFCKLTNVPLTRLVEQEFGWSSIQIIIDSLRRKEYSQLCELIEKQEDDEKKPKVFLTLFGNTKAQSSYIEIRCIYIVNDTEKNSNVIDIWDIYNEDLTRQDGLNIYNTLPSTSHLNTVLCHFEWVT